jgi:glycosyltransferase involved in cell wall biosynthesis
VYIPKLNLLFVCISHPFWKNRHQHLIDVEALSCIVDWTRNNKNFNVRIIITGDFNDLREYLIDIERPLEIENVVKFPTRGENSLDLIFTNCQHLYAAPRKVIMLGSSDHDAILWPCVKVFVL